MRSLVRSIHLHDRMTARHSAAVARYARGIARAAGCSDEDQQLVHTAGLLHDVGKHILDDAILKGDTKLDDQQWELVKRHPEEGARIVRMLEGQEAVAEIIHAHHERVDGRGYPRGLSGEEIPRLSRMISIADTYDVMTARDSYRDPVSSAEAIAELRRVSGAQLDGELVEIFVRQVLGHEDTAFAHGDDADFEAELAGGRTCSSPPTASGARRHGRRRAAAQRRVAAERPLGAVRSAVRAGFSRTTPGRPGHGAEGERALPVVPAVRAQDLRTSTVRSARAAARRWARRRARARASPSGAPGASRAARSSASSPSPGAS